jgi:hypothetical protein
VDQISPPFRIAIVAMLAMCALWLTVLKPKDPAADAPLPTAPGVTGLGNDVKAAKGAAAASDAANAKLQKASGGTTTATTPAAATKPKTAATGAHAAVAGKNGGIAAPAAKPKAKTATATKASADGAAALLRALDDKHAVVLLFWNRRGSDDRAVRRAVQATDRHHGRVVVKAVTIADVGRFEAITRGAQVLQSPTVLVIGPDHKARAIAGFTTTGELDQAVGDTLARVKSAK